MSHFRSVLVARSSTLIVGVAILLGVAEAASADPAPALDAATGLASAVDPGAEDVVPSSPREVLEKALQNRYDFDARARIYVRLKAPGGAISERRVEAAAKHIDGQLHSIGIFTYPEELRDTALLAIDYDDRDSDHFVWLPEFRKIRRVSSAQRADLFSGTDAAFEDLEERHIADYATEFGESTVVEGEEVWVVESTPTFASGYGRVEYFVSKRDAAVLRTLFFKRDAEEPFKRIETPREHTREINGHVLPLEILVTNLERGTETFVKIEKLEVNPDLSNRLFTTRNLTQRRRLPDLD